MRYLLGITMILMLSCNQNSKEMSTKKEFTNTSEKDVEMH